MNESLCSRSMQVLAWSCGLIISHTERNCASRLFFSVATLGLSSAVSKNVLCYCCCNSNWKVHVAPNNLNHNIVYSHFRCHVPTFCPRTIMSLTYLLTQWRQVWNCIPTIFFYAQLGSIEPYNNTVWGTFLFSRIIRAYAHKCMSRQPQLVL